MGSKPSKKTIRFLPKENSNGKKIFITFELCESWSFIKKEKKFKNFLINELLKKGYEIIYNIFPVKNNGEFNYDIYIEFENNQSKKLLFTNDRNKKKFNDCIFGYEVNDSNCNDIINKIEKYYNN